jgi:hypothetical protein
LDVDNVAFVMRTVGCSRDIAEHALHKCGLLDTETFVALNAKAAMALNAEAASMALKAKGGWSPQDVATSGTGEKKSSDNTRANGGGATVEAEKEMPALQTAKDAAGNNAKASELLANGNFNTMFKGKAIKRHPPVSLRRPWFVGEDSRGEGQGEDADAGTWDDPHGYDVREPSTPPPKVVQRLSQEQLRVLHERRHGATKAKLKQPESEGNPHPTEHRREPAGAPPGVEASAQVRDVDA